MSAVFLKIVNMSISACWMILAVMLIRILFKRAPKWIMCLLWALVAFRLVVPFSIKSTLSLVPSSETIPHDIALMPTPVIDSGIPEINEIVNPIIVESFAPEPTNSINPLQVVIYIASRIWIVGIVILLIYALISYLRLRKTVSASILIQDGMMACDDISTPFILGLFSPKIYIPSSMEGKTLDYVIRHEKAHISRRDHWWKPLGYLILTVYWFNPLCWIAYILLCRDIEAACDEKVIEHMDKDNVAGYSQALLDCSMHRKMIAACPLAFGENNVKHRIKGILNYRKPAFWIIMIAISACIIVAVCLMTDPFSTKTLDGRLKESMDTVIADRHSSNSSRGSYSATSYDVLGTTRSDGSITVYAMIYYGDYSYDGKELVNISGTFGPAAITFDISSDKEGSTYKVIEYWEPRDGGYYEEDIKSKFPRSIQRKAFDVSSVDDLKKRCLKSASDYFSDQPPYKQIYADTFVIGAGDFHKMNPSSYQMNNETDQTGHIPVFLIDSLNDMNRIRSMYEAAQDKQPKAHNIPFPLDVLRPNGLYDEAFFSEHSLLVAFYEAGSSSFKYSVRGVYLCDYGQTLVMSVIETNHPEAMIDDLRNWLFVAEVLDTDIRKCSRYDAVEVPSQQDTTENLPTISFKATITDGASDSELIYKKCLNHNERMRWHKTEQSWQTPLFLLNTLEDLNEFREDFKDIIYTRSESGVGRISFEEAVNGYDQDFFVDHSLLIVYINSPTLTAVYSLYKIINDSTYLRVYVSQDDEGSLDAETSWFLIAEVSDEDVSGFSYYDAMVIRNKNIADFMETTEDIEARTDYIKGGTESEEGIKKYYLWMDDGSIDVEQLKYDMIIEYFGDFETYMNGDGVTFEEADEFHALWLGRLRETYTESNTRMIKSIEEACGFFEIVFFDTYSPMCIVKMSDKQIQSLSESDIPVYYEEFIDLPLQIELD